MAAALGLDRARGAVINELLEGGPADKAGLDKGDVILSVDGTDINDDSGLRFKLATLRPRETVDVDYVRDGRERVTRVRVDIPQESPARDERELDGVHPFNGATIENMSPALGEELGFDPYLEGVMVLKVRRGSAANYNRLRPGDFVLDVNDTPISSARQLESILLSEPIDVVWDVQIDRSGRIGALPIRYLPPQN
jgi:S1-C subfamily serine protease